MTDELTRRPKPITDIQSLRVEFDPQKYNLLAPVVHMPGGLPPGTRFVVTEITINPDPAVKEVFPLPGGMLMPSKVSLDKIGNAAGISWIEERRQDAATHPHYCEMFVRGKMRDFDGTERQLTGVKAVDLREDAGGGIYGKDYDEIVSKARAGNRDPGKQLMEARKFIQEIAASKAKNRAIASGLGIKRGYTKQELSRPFVVPKLSIDPTDPRVQAEVRAGMLGETAVKAMYGPNSAPIDAEFAESATPAEPSAGNGGQESVGAHPPAPADSTPPPMSGEPGPEPQSKPSAEELRQRLGAAWEIARNGRMTPKQWPELLRNNTQKAHESEFTFEDLDLLDGAVAAFVENMKE